jgi:RimJ/RimL family protein N-acetyltransferase
VNATAPRAWEKPDPLPGPIQTERTVLRWWEPRDAEGLEEAVSGDRQALLPWLPWAASSHASAEESLETIQRFARDRNQADARDFVMGIFDRATGAVIGGTGFHRLSVEDLMGEIGYWIRGSAQRRGYATEAVSGLITAGFGPWGFRRITICCAGRNVASQAIPEKLGIRLEGVEREANWIDGVGWDDHLTYAVLAHEWDAGAGRVRKG